jgi:chromosome segregation ATPase
METTTVSLQILNQLRQMLVGLRDETSAAFGEVHTQLGGAHTQLGGLHAQLGGIHTQLGGIHTQLAEAHTQLAEVKVRLDEHGDRLATLEHNGAASHEILEIVNHRLSFFERSATTATEGRARLEDRVDETHARLDRVETYLAQQDTLQRA